MERWYRFSSAGSKPLYGFGTLEQPFNFASQLNRTRERIYSTAAITNAEAQGLPLEDNAEALSLTLTLAKEAALREPDYRSLLQFALAAGHRRPTAYNRHTSVLNS